MSFWSESEAGCEQRGKYRQERARVINMEMAKYIAKIL